MRLVDRFASQGVSETFGNIILSKSYLFDLLNIEEKQTVLRNLDVVEIGTLSVKPYLVFKEVQQIKHQNPILKQYYKNQTQQLI